MSPKDPFLILDVTRTATLKEIKSSYRKLALQEHPDKNFNTDESKEKFQDIVWAYEELSNPIKRAKYSSTDTQTTEEPFKEDPLSEELIEILALLAKFNLNTENNKLILTELSKSKRIYLCNILKCTLTTPHINQAMLDKLFSYSFSKLEQLSELIDLLTQKELDDTTDISFLFNDEHYSILTMHALFLKIESYPISLSKLNLKPLFQSFEHAELMYLQDVLDLLMKTNEDLLNNDTVNLLFNNIQLMGSFWYMLDGIATINKSLITKEFISFFSSLALSFSDAHGFISRLKDLHAINPFPLEAQLLNNLLLNHRAFNEHAFKLTSLPQIKQLHLTEASIIESIKHPEVFEFLSSIDWVFCLLGEKLNTANTLRILENASHTANIEAALTEVVRKKYIPFSNVLLAKIIDLATQSNSKEETVSQAVAFAEHSESERNQQKITDIKNNLKLDLNNIEHLQYWDKLTSRGWFNTGGKALFIGDQEFRVPTRVYNMMQLSTKAEQYPYSSIYVEQLNVHRISTPLFGGNPFSFLTRNQKTAEFYETPDISNLVLK